MTCPKCQGFIMTNHDEQFCINCSYRVGTPVPAFQPKPSKRRVGTEHMCICGRAKVPWRSKCRPCILRSVKHWRQARAEEKEREARYIKTEFGADSGNRKGKVGRARDRQAT